LLDDFLKRPHQEVREIAAQIGSRTVRIGDLTHLPTHCKFLALMPQWDFLNFIAEHGKHYPGFQIRMRTEAIDLIEQSGCVAGVRAKAPDGVIEIRASLTVGADGRQSIVRERAGLQVMDLGAPMDVFWMRISRRPDDAGHTFGHVEPGRMLVLINREEYWQCAYLIPKGTAEEVRKNGIGQFREEIAKLEPLLRDRVGELRDWNDVSLLTVKVDRLKRWWRPGLLCIGDAAHAMSPVGGVGINLAIQDAVAAANILAAKLAAGAVSEKDLQAIQQRREFPTRATQKLQLAIQNAVIERVLSSAHPLTIPWPIKLMQRLPRLLGLTARIVGMGFRPEHVRTPEIALDAES
ncbi:MAG: FAD-dependent oxidoreductase, partial [Candidatus Sulfotelmatobacter sp.]